MKNIFWSRLRVVFGCCAVLSAPLFSQAPEVAKTAEKPAPEAKKSPFWADIEAFEAEDKKNPPPQNAVLFLGSSSIRLWKTLAEDFPELTVINRGFGGSQITDSIRYAERIVIPYKPKLIVFYAGTNDVNAGKTPQQVAKDFEQFAAKVHAALPATRIAFISINPSVKRAAIDHKMRDANRLIEAFIHENDGKKGKLSYLESYSKMLDANGKARPEILQTDGLHLNKEGYKLWLSVLKPQIMQLLENEN